MIRQYPTALAHTRRHPPFRVTGGGSIAFAAILVLLAGCAGQGNLIDGDEIPPEIARIPDAVPKYEPLSKSGNPDSYVIRGQRFYVKRTRSGHVERGLASWYGQPFHGRKTSSGEIYNMHGMTAAHKTLPLPTYARVTNVENGRSIVVKINDRGPFHGSRIVDLSYTAAVKLGVFRKGTAMVEVRAIDPGGPGSRSSLWLADRSEPEPQAARRSPPVTASRQAARVDAAPIDGRRPATLAGATGSPRVSTGSGSSRATESAGNRPLYLQIGAFGDPQNAERLRMRLSAGLLTEQVRVLTPQRDEQPLYKVRIGPVASEQAAEHLTQRLASLGLTSAQRVRN